MSSSFILGFVLVADMVFIQKSAGRSRPAFHPVVGEKENTESIVDPTASPAPTSSYNGYGRIFQRQTSPFIAISTIVVAGILHETADSGDEATDDIASMRVIQCWDILCGIIPNFREQMLQLSADPKTRRAVCSQIGAGAAAARCDDTAGLKSCILDYVLADTVASRQLGLERKGKKVDRGFNHPITASLLCPIKYMATEETFNQLKTGLLPCGASLLPRFLFPENQVYNSEDVEEGCFRGHLLLRTHFSLTSAATWDRIVGMFDYNEFYWNLLEFLEGPEGEDIIKLFNYHVFGLPIVSKSINTDTEESDFDVIKLQRAAKRARLSAVSTSTMAPPMVITTHDQSAAMAATACAAMEAPNQPTGSTATT
ncbi:hypothetical protein HYPSUDRAFT_203728 [Hypholoma sublateritium FD-334 SS-4]|uniref:Uncharacterized protein n=1 Tax=Hypholoma sublateritium (strain FD-334 SS-4) TaxID=945553 RepID=A0A0D2PKY4_HYPSF|nr:hypothetical protein HYPSUDRAFT_203728 [Hypholoma sublateritium FD-334 SS-4]